jgi:hypothetical protein
MLGFVAYFEYIYQATSFTSSPFQIHFTSSLHISLPKAKISSLSTTSSISLPSKRHPARHVFPTYPIRALPSQQRTTARRSHAAFILPTTDIGNNEHIWNRKHVWKIEHFEHVYHLEYVWLERDDSPERQVEWPTRTRTTVDRSSLGMYQLIGLNSLDDCFSMVCHHAWRIRLWWYTVGEDALEMDR